MNNSLKAEGLSPDSSQPQGAFAVQVECLVCGDRATGKHYGSVSCDGCKGFFRRTVRKNHSYMCRFSRSCVVDKNRRNTCRKCRFDKCLRKGMRSEAVQQERDTISTGHTPATPSDTSPTRKESTNSSTETTGTTLHDARSGSQGMVSAQETLNGLLRAEETMRQMRASVITRTVDAYRTATTGDVTESMHQQLSLMVEWAKQLEPFNKLAVPAKIGLLRHFSSQHLVICAAFRSIAVADAVWLTNESFVPRDAPKIPDVNRVAARVLDHVAAPMRRLHLSETEYVALKAVAFFDPVAKGVEESAVEIEKARASVLSAFEYHVTKVSIHRETPLRMVNLLLLLPPIMAIARDLAEEAQLAKLFGLANVDELMAELLLPEATGATYTNLKTSVGSSLVPSPIVAVTTTNSMAPAAHGPLELGLKGAHPSILHALQHYNGITTPTPLHPLFHKHKG